jgi:hypothetical protein
MKIPHTSWRGFSFDPFAKYQPIDISPVLLQIFKQDIFKLQRR